MRQAQLNHRRRLPFRMLDNKPQAINSAKRRRRFAEDADTNRGGLHVGGLMTSIMCPFPV